MWIRSAFWIGKARPGLEHGFRRGVDSEMVPAIRALPGVVAARAFWPQRFEDGSPDLACQILVEFDDRAGVDRMLASSERHALRTRSAEIISMFDGTLSHIDCEVS